MSKPIAKHIGGRSVRSAWCAGFACLIVCLLLHMLAVAQPAVEKSSRESIAQYSHDAWQTDDGLPQNSISSIVQTRDGYLWLGTLEGLVRFDGVQFTVFNVRNTPAMQSNRILALLMDHSGMLWIGTENGGLMSYSQGQFTTYTMKEGLSHNVVSSLCEDQNGTLWIGTSGKGLNGFRDKKFSHFTTSDGLLGNGITALCTDSRGIVWIGTEAGLNRYKDGKFTSLTKENGLVNDNVGSLSSSTDGSLWIGTAKGLSRYNKSVFTNFTTEQGLSNNYVWSVRSCDDGSILIGTQGGGLTLYKNGTMSRFTSDDGLTNDFVWSVFEDVEKNIWIGTNGGGLNRLKNGLFTTYTGREGLSNDFSWSIAEGRDGSVWVGTYNGLNHLVNGRFVSYTTRDGLSDNFIWSVYVDRKGTVWAGTANGLSVFSGGVFKTYSTHHGLTSNVIRSLYEDKSGGMWIGTTKGLNHFDGHSFASYPLSDGLPGGLVMSICEDHEGSLWVGTAGGLYRLKDYRIQSFRTDSSLSRNIIRALYEDIDHNLWIGTQGGGLTLYRENNFYNITTKNGLYDDVISQILEDHHGNLWMSCNNGIFRVQKSQLVDIALGGASTVSSVVYGKADGMMSRECNGSSQPAGCRTSDGKFWFPTIKGVVMVDPNKLKINELAPPVIIENVVIDNVQKDIFHSIESLPGMGDLEVQYTGLSFLAPEKVHFKYKLEGYDRDWMDVGGRRTAYYTNLPPGKYTFRVKACNNDGVWNEAGDFVRIDLQPHFYQQAWFYGACGIVFLALAFGAYRYRIRSLRAREAKLINLVVERTKHLQQEKENADRARTESERQKELAQDANKIKTELLNIAAHDLKSPLVSIKMLSKIIMEESKEPGQIPDFASDIYSSAQRMHNLVNELLESAWIESGNLVLKKKHLDLSQLTELVVMDNRISATQKQQKIVFTPQTGCIVIGDEERLREVLDNLLSNAIKYSPLEKVIVVNVKNGGPNVRVEVRDEGPGLTDEDKQNIFGKFQKLSAKPTAGEPSTGLGLSIVKQLIEVHDGKVSVDSRYGKGSTFTIELPKAEM